MKTNELYLHHILDAIDQVESYPAEIDREAFEIDRMKLQSSLSIT